MLLPERCHHNASFSSQLLLEMNVRILSASQGSYGSEELTSLRSDDVTYPVYLNITKPTESLSIIFSTSSDGL